MKHRIIAGVLILTALLTLTGCASTSDQVSWRLTLLEVNNWSPEKFTAARDAEMVVYDRGGTEFSEGHVKSKPEYEDEETTWVGDVWTALVSILPDWNVRITVAKFEYDEVTEPLFEEEE